MIFANIDDLEYRFKDLFAGQDDLKKLFATMIFIQHASCEDFKDSMPRPVLFINGKTGTGKTYCLQKMCRRLGVPFSRFDCSLLTNVGFSGEDVIDVLKDHVKLYRYHPGLKQSVLFFDEVDKLTHGVQSTNGNTPAINIQHSLLSLLEGEKACLPELGNPLIVLGGSFQQQLDEQGNRSNLGFLSEEVTQSAVELDKNKLTEFGLIKELVGRITTVYSMQKLTPEQLKDAINGPHSRVYMQYYNFCARFGRTFFLTTAKVNEIITEVNTSEFGLRCIDSAVHKLGLEFISKELKHCLTVDGGMQEYFEDLNKKGNYENL